MPQPLTTIQNAQKHKIDGDAPWLLLLQVDMPDGVTHLYAAKNPTDIVYPATGGNTYSAFAFNIEEIVDKSTGEISNVSLSLSNVTRMIQPYLEQYDGMVGATVTLRVISAADMDGAPAIELSFEVTEASATAERVTFILGADNPMRQGFPKFRYLKDFCNWEFNSPALRALGNPNGRGTQCGYLGADTTCSHHLNDANGCRAKAMQERFGGFPGIDSQGYVFATSQ